MIEDIIFSNWFLVSLPIILVFTIIVKAFALWHSARRGQKGWFIALIILNTLGILDVIYLLMYKNKDSK